MAAPLNTLESASSQGFRANRTGDLVVITMPGASFATTARDHQMVQQWARARPSLGNPQRDRTIYCSLHSILLARTGGGLANKGTLQALAQLVQSMRQAGMDLKDWQIPRDLPASAADAPEQPA